MITHYLSGYLVVGTVAMLIATLILAGVVYHDLAPSIGLNGRGRWLLMAGLGGMGILAFTAKLIVITLLLSMSEKIISPESIKKLQKLVTPLTVLSENSEPPASFRSPYKWEALPDQAPAPEWNPTTPEKVMLGEKLFFDKSLSLNGQIACASCHDVLHGAGVDGLKTSKGIHGQVGKRNAPTVWNAAFQIKLFWDGRASSLEEQAKGPLINPSEMGMPSLDMAVERVASSSMYQKEFREAFGEKSPISIANIAAAIAAYERTLITPDSPYDRFVKGDSEALTPAQIRGMALFESVECVRCHSGPNFSGASIFDGNAPLRTFPTYKTPFTEKYKLTDDLGISSQGSKNGVWRIPSLRNVAITGPYFHNGSVKNLEEAVRVMLGTQLGRSERNIQPPGQTILWSNTEQSLISLNRKSVTEADIKDISAFLTALSSENLLRKARKSQQPGHQKKSFSKCARCDASQNSKSSVIQN